MVGEAERDKFGWLVSGAGDVNGDGYDDVIVGAHAAGRALSNRRQELEEFIKRFQNGQVLDREKHVVPQYYEIRGDRIYFTDRFLKRVRLLCV